jgi:acid stress-induced BolA-like protein IbaG/YrbA
MNEDDIKKMIEEGLAGSQVIVSGDGTHYEATVIYKDFAGKSMIEQHRMVYGTLGDSMQGGAIHALSIRTYTPQDWSRLIKTPNNTQSS